MIKLLDCTLRDGGYYTNWDFDKELIKNYLLYIDKLPIEYIEVGYRSGVKTEYLGEYFYLPVSTLRYIKSYTSKKIAVMLNAKDCMGINLKSLLRDTKDYISLVRIATDPNKIQFSLSLAKELKKLGFEVAINIMYITTIKENYTILNDLKGIEEYVDILNLVDSYGSIYPKELESLIELVRKKTDVSLGFHGHNNIELAFSNTLVAIENGIDIIDSTVLGMGRGAGNLKLELILMYFKINKIFDVDLNILGKLIELFNPLLNKYKWGTNLAYMVSGNYSLPQKEVMDSLEINRYSLSGIVHHIKNETKMKIPKFNDVTSFENCFIIGGGESIKNNIDAIREYLSLNKDMLVIYSTSKYIKLFEGIINTQYFAVSGDELLKIEDDIKSISKYILEPSPRKVNVNIQNQTNFYELTTIDFIDNYIDSPLTISLQISITVNAKHIYLVGFDGYSELKNKKELYLMQENQNIINSFIKDKELISLTPTKYINLIGSSIYGVLA
jgi:4-hydroxy 2-oxovalerate aldolase